MKPVTIALAAALALTACGGLTNDRVVPAAVYDDDAGTTASHDPILDRYVRAVCACGDGFSGCDANVRGEVAQANRSCLLRYAELYEVSCDGRLPDGGWTLGCSL